MMVGFLIVRHTDKVLEWFGYIDYAEEKFGPGGSRFLYKIIGILAVFIGIFIATNIISDILGSFAGLFAQ